MVNQWQKYKCIDKLFLFPLYTQAVLDIECNGETALMLAAKGGHTETVQALIEVGAEVKSKKNVRIILPSAVVKGNIIWDTISAVKLCSLITNSRGPQKKERF